MTVPARALLSWRTACLAVSFAVVALLSPIASAVTYTVSAPSNGDYYWFSGFGMTNNPTLTLVRGTTYVFSLDISIAREGHPFNIQFTRGGPGAAYTGVINGGADSGDVTFNVPLTAPNTLYYQCLEHDNMWGTINITDPPMAAAPAWSDFDGDARSDILWRNASTGENYVYPMDGTTIKPTEGYVRTVADQGWQVAGIGDFNGDGRADVLWRNSSTGENYLYMMTGTAISPEGFIRTVADQNWRVAGIGDFDGDGKADILWRNQATGDNYIYLMDGLSIKAGEGYLRNVDQNWQVAGVGDFDGDAKADIFWRNAVTGQNYVYPMNGLAIKPTEGYSRTVADLNWKVAAVGDFDGDGKAGILWRSSATGENYIYEMNGTAIVAEGYLRTVADQNWRVAAVGDYSGDGKADILWRNAATGEDYIYPMNGRAILATEGFIRTVPAPWSPVR